MLKSDNFEYLLDTRLKKVFEKTWKNVPSRLDKVYKKETSSKASEYEYSMGDIGLAEKFDGQINYQETYGQYRSTYTHEEYASGIRIGRKLLDDDQYNIISNQPRLLARAIKLKREDDAVSTFVNAFSSSYAGGDAVELCDSAHPNLGTDDTQSNTGTSELTITNLKSIRLLMRKYETDKGNKAGIMPNALIVPDDLADGASEITKSPKVPYEISNTPNVQEGRFSIIDWMYLVDTNNWFMVDTSMMKMFLTWIDRVKPEFNKDKDTDTYVHKYSAYNRYSKGWSDWKFVYGNNVS